MRLFPLPLMHHQQFCVCFLKPSSRPLPLALPATVVLKAMVILKFCPSPDRRVQIKIVFLPFSASRPEGTGQHFCVCFLFHCCIVSNCCFLKPSSRPLPLALPAMVVLKAMVIVKLFCSIGKCSAADEELSFALLCFFVFFKNFYCTIFLIFGTFLYFISTYL